MAQEKAARFKKVRLRPSWRIWWELTQAEDDFPSDADYGGSTWHQWERRIKEGHKKEEEELGEWYDKRKEECSGSEDALYWLGDWAADEHYQTRQVTGTMYAALVVSMWARMEHILKSLLRTWYLAVDTEGKTLKKVARLCSKGSAGKEWRGKLKSCIKSLKKIQAGVPRDFKAIKEAFKGALKVDLGVCKDYAAVNAARILNNCFKHDHGCYRLEGRKPHDVIDKDVFREWVELDQHDRIEYSKLPMREMVVACGTFTRDLFDKVKVKLKKTSA